MSTERETLRVLRDIAASLRKIAGRPDAPEGVTDAPDSGPIGPLTARAGQAIWAELGNADRRATTNWHYPIGPGPLTQQEEA